MVAVKGGVWTNIEDEVLKAAISKYGLNQWARVSSLLARKTPKQCKARWNEYLDPSIRKIEWSKDEDEKLLHLAKLMPTQWRTIAPIVGRTANQCLERYQRLLDDAEQREASELGLTGTDGGDAQAPTADNVRRLRPGEVDPDPESKPARPDTIDLDEDEKEMLSEARARLANTQGKKAKRKARERQQEEARRLANLQKRRELKTAGINIKVVTRKQGEMDYNADIPFEKKPAMGFYDTSEEIQRNERQREAFDPRQQSTTNKRKGDEGEDAGRKKRKGDKDGDQAAHQAAMKAGQMQRLREAEQSSKRRALVLPAPQVSETELEEIVKMGAIGERANMLARESENEATRGLLQNYSTVQTGAPIRTPRAAPEEDRVANEIRNIRALTETQSSLLGGENTPLREGAGSTGFETATPRKQVLATPNPLATPLRNGGGTGGALATPLRPGQTPLRTPRDGFALNAGGEPIPVRSRLAQGLAALPKPKDTEWDLELPEAEEEERRQQAAADEAALVEDAADRDRRERERLEAQELLARKRRTQVMQRGLPRPSTVDLAALLEKAAGLDDAAEALVAHEAALLVANDAAQYPVPGSRKKQTGSGTAPQLDRLEDGLLAEARLQVLLEARKAPAPETITSAWGGLVHAAAAGTNALLLGLGCYDEDEDEMERVRSAFESVHEAMLASAEKGAKLEKRLAVHLGGYKHRADLLRNKMGEAHEALQRAEAARNGFEILARSEEVAIGRRLAALRQEVAYVSRREREAQELYRANREELASLGVRV
ncbi:cell division control protein [Grosmannia clavigera kw1407]|uniref:Cell division control protein n=1 Tax=Grosmannia clavigera (strain kw1407 / UAMH 11150) TaxID=655863 RepID=F0X8M0_GROCL|nr:cell division control protein [Grosmannia clavigera kw1407]EFX05898.1 cell division control protein [Grosmannia clavigera kw1407]